MPSAPGAQRLALSPTTVYWAFATGAGRVGLNGGTSTTLSLGPSIAVTLERGIPVDPGSGAPYVTMPGNLRGAATGFIGSAGDVSSIVVTATNAFVGSSTTRSAEQGGSGGRTSMGPHRRRTR